MNRSPKSFFGNLWYSFLDIKGPVLWLITFSLGVLFRIFTLNQQVSLDWIIPLFLFLLVIIITIFKTAYDLFNENRKALPSVLVVKKIETSDEAPKYLCLLEASELFSHGIMVSFYYDDGNFEMLIGLGLVEHIREDKKIQVQIIGTETGYEDVMKKFKSNEGEIIKKINVKPHIPQRYSSLYSDKALEEVTE